MYRDFFLYTCTLLYHRAKNNRSLYRGHDIEVRYRGQALCHTRCRMMKVSCCLVTRITESFPFVAINFSLRPRDYFCLR